MGRSIARPTRDLQVAHETFAFPRETSIVAGVEGESVSRETFLVQENETRIVFLGPVTLVVSAAVSVPLDYVDCGCIGHLRFSPRDPYLRRPRSVHESDLIG